MKQRIILVISALLLGISALAGPATKGPVYLVQPDGTGFSARIRGDEYMKIITTEGGNSIIQEKDGWWCYAYYDTEGGKASSGVRVGSDAPDGVMNSSRSIPYGRLAANAKIKRLVQPQEEEPLMKRIMKLSGADTKSSARQTVTKHGIIILAQFRDKKFNHTKDDFINMLTQNGYDRNGATGSAKEYFDDQFNGAFEFSFDVSDIVTLPSAMADYGGNDSDGDDIAPHQMIIDACNLADSKVDFSLYDDDGDGFVDNVFVFFAGGDEAEGAGEDCIWSHAWYIKSGAKKDLVLDGKQIDRYACTAELSRRYTNASSFREVLAGIGTFCHEYFHTFGIPDMYDTDYDESGGSAAALWAWTSLMDSGNQNNYGNTPPYLNAVEREYLGISEPVKIETHGGYTLEPVHRNGMSYRLDTDHEDEYFLIEYRSAEGWDAHIGGSGMLIYHIDKSRRSSGFSDTFGEDLTAYERWQIYNELNCRPDHQCADLLEADGRRDSFGANETEFYHAQLRNIQNIFFPNVNTDEIHPDSSPGLTYWSGEICPLSITNIREADGSVMFNVIGFEGTILPPNVSSVKTEVFMDAAIITFESDKRFNGEATIEWGKTGGETQKVLVAPYDTGKYSVTLENLEPDNKTYTVKIYFELDGLTGRVNTTSFMTKKRPTVEWPYIYMNGVARNSDGTIPAGSKLPLRVYNAADAAEITWKFNGVPVSVGGDGYFTVNGSGKLKAHIIWEDGSEESIMKEITIGKEEEK